MHPWALGLEAELLRLTFVDDGETGKLPMVYILLGVRALMEKSPPDEMLFDRRGRALRRLWPVHPLLRPVAMAAEQVPSRVSGNLQAIDVERLSPGC